MSESTAWIELYELRDPPEARERAVLEAQSRRVAAMLKTDTGRSGALFAVEPQSYPCLLARLADESAS